MVAENLKQVTCPLIWVGSTDPILITLLITLLIMG